MRRHQSEDDLQNSYNHPPLSHMYFDKPTPFCVTNNRPSCLAAKLGMQAVRPAEGALEPFHLIQRILLFFFFFKIQDER